MTLKETLQSDLTAALRSRDELKLSTLRGLVGTIQSQEKGGKTAVEFNDAQVIEVIGRQVKQRKESAEIYANAGATDRSERELAEATVLEAYLPVQLTEVEIRKIIADVLVTGATNFGEVMKLVTPQTKGKADGKLVADLVKQTLEV